MSLVRYTGAADRAAEVTRAWEGRTVALVCAGPSLVPEQLALLRDHQVPTIAVNDAYLVAPWAQVLYFADAGWYFWHSAGIAKRFGDKPTWAEFPAWQVAEAFRGFAGQKVTIRPLHAAAAPSPDVYVLEQHGTTPEGLSDVPTALRTGLHSGYQALNLVVHSRPARVLLVGWDLRQVNGRSHAHQGHPKPGFASNLALYESMYRTIEQRLQELGIEVVNCTAGSALKRFRFSTLAQELAPVTV